MIYPYHYFTAGALAIFIGVAVGSYFSVDLGLGLVVLTFCLLGIWLAPLAWVKFWLVVVAGVALGMFRFEQGLLTPLSPLHLDRSVTLSGRIVSHPEFQDNRQSFYLQIETLDEEVMRGRPKILLQTFSRTAVAYGTAVTAAASLQADVDSSYLRYLHKDGVVAIGQASGDIEIVTTAPPSLLGGLYWFRDVVSTRINTLFPEPSAGLMNGLLLGLRAQLSDELKTNLKNSGTTHIIALSGFNISVIAGFLLFLAQPLKRHWALVVAGVGILLFVLMTGASSSVVRAAIMGWIMLMTLWWGRRHYGLNAVLVAGAIMVLLNPYILQYDIGFQLSLVATLGIIVSVPRLSLYLRWLPKILSEIVATTIAATIFTLPLVTFHFGGFSLVSLITNLLVLPLIPPVMLVGFATVLVMLIIPWSGINLVGVAGAQLILGLINWFGSWRLAFVSTPHISVWGPVVYYLLLFIGYLRSHDKKIFSLRSQ